MPAQADWSKGFVQRANRNLYQPDELLVAVNVVPDPEGGGVTTRLGDTVIGNLTGRVHSLYTTYTTAGVQVTYQGAGTTLYRYYAALLTGLSGSPISFATMPGFGEKTVYTYFANGQDALRLKDNGVSATNWGLKPPTTGIFAGVADTGGQLEGMYAWRQVYVRKPTISGGVFGRWTDSTSSYNLTGTTPFLLSDGPPGNGTVFGAPQPWDEVVLPLTTTAITPSGSIEYSYWNGNQWIPWLTTTFGVYTATLTSFRNNFSFNAWVPLNGLYLLRARVLVGMTGGVPVFTNTIFYDGVYAARSNPSPASLASGPYHVATTPNRAAVTFSSPFGLPDAEIQATHVAIYRTTGDDAALLTGGLGTSEALYFFERDYPVGANTHLSIIPDNQLGELLELDNDRPPPFDKIAVYQDRIFGISGNQLWYSKRSYPESFPGTNFLYVGSLADPLQNLAEYHGNFYAWTKEHVYLLLGSDETSFDTRLVQCPVGLGAPNSLGAGSKALYFLGSDGHLWGLEGSIASTVSRIGHQQLFDGVALYGIPGIDKIHRNFCVGHWGHGRYRFSYPVAPVIFPLTGLMIDEDRGSWWSDTRPWQSLWYDKQADQWYGGLADGTVVFLDSGTTDHGTPITAYIQTHDEDFQAPDSDKDLSQLVVEVLTSTTGVTVTPVVGYDVASTALGTITSLTFTQTILPSPAPGTYRGITLGYVVAGTAPWSLYGLMAHVLRTPVRLRTWETLPTTFSWAGPKILESVLLDVELVSGTLSWQLIADGVLVEMGTISTLGRQVPQLITMRHEATVFSLVFQGTGLFLFYDGSVISWRPLPPPIYNHIVVPQDLGTMQDKVGLAYALDVELLSAGTMTMTFYVDGTLAHTITYTTLGRQRTERFRMPASVRGRLMEIRTQSTAPYRLWNGTDYEFQVVGATQAQHYRPVTEPYGQSTSTPMLQLPHAEEA